MVKNKWKLWKGDKFPTELSHFKKLHPCHSSEPQISKFPRNKAQKTKHHKTFMTLRSGVPIYHFPLKEIKKRSQNKNS
jgi:hypothetical protein